MSENGISKKKQADVNRRLEALGVFETDLREDFIKGSGKGGQKINKTSSCVQLTYLKTGMVVRCQQSRSREQNRFFARRILLTRLENEFLGRKSAENKRIYKLKAQKRKRSKRAKEKVLESKKHRAKIKDMRKKPEV